MVRRTKWDFMHTHSTHILCLWARKQTFMNINGIASKLGNIINLCFWYCINWILIYLGASYNWSILAQLLNKWTHLNKFVIHFLPTPSSPHPDEAQCSYFHLIPILNCFINRYIKSAGKNHFCVIFLFPKPDVSFPAIPFLCTHGTQRKYIRTTQCRICSTTMYLSKFVKTKISE